MYKLLCYLTVVIIMSLFCRGSHLVLNGLLWKISLLFFVISILPVIQFFILLFTLGKNHLFTMSYMISVPNRSINLALYRWDELGKIIIIYCFILWETSTLYNVLYFFPCLLNVCMIFLFSCFE